MCSNDYFRWAQINCCSLIIGANLIIVFTRVCIQTIQMNLCAGVHTTEGAGVCVGTCVSQWLWVNMCGYVCVCVCVSVYVCACQSVCVYSRGECGVSCMVCRSLTVSISRSKALECPLSLFESSETSILTRIWSASFRVRTNDNRNISATH